MWHVFLRLSLRGHTIFNLTRIQYLAQNVYKELILT